MFENNKMSATVLLWIVKRKKMTVVRSFHLAFDLTVVINGPLSVGIVCTKIDYERSCTSCMECCLKWTVAT